MTSTVSPPPRRVHRRKTYRRPLTCPQCNVTFTPRRSDRRCRFCSHRCQTATLRGIVWSFALIWWVPCHGSWEARWVYFPRRQEALAAAPHDRVWSIADISRRPWITWPSIYEIARRTRLIDSDDPYKATSKGDRKWLS